MLYFRAISFFSSIAFLILSISFLILSISFLISTIFSTVFPFEAFFLFVSISFLISTIYFLSLCQRFPSHLQRFLKINKTRLYFTISSKYVTITPLILFFCYDIFPFSNNRSLLNVIFAHSVIFIPATSIKDEVRSVGMRSKHQLQGRKRVILVASFSLLGVRGVTLFNLLLELWLRQENMPPKFVSINNSKHLCLFVYFF